MARPLRMPIEDGWYHVFHRGTERCVIFRDSRDRQHFLDLMGCLPERFRFRIHGFVLMDNHYHAIIQTPDANLSQGMQWLHLSHAAWFNARHDRVGPLWQGRFRDVPVENSAWAYELSLYIHLNVVSTEEFGFGKRKRKAERHGLRTPSKEEVTRRLAKLREYPWSSYRCYGGYEKGPPWLESQELLRRASRKAAARHKAYREDTQGLAAHGVEPSKREKLRDTVAIGSEEFSRKLRALAKGGVRETSGKRLLRRRVSLKDVIRAVEKIKGEKWSKFSGRHGDWGRPLVMCLARQYCGATLREIGEELGGMDYAAVSIALKRFEGKANKNRKLKQQKQLAVQMLNVET